MGVFPPGLCRFSVCRVPRPLADSDLLAAYEQRSGSRFGYEYAVKDGMAPRALDVLADEGAIKTDDRDMAIEYPFASSQDRDRVGDFLHVGGIETANHERNPLSFLDHGKNFKWPLGLDQDKQKRYTVHIDPQRGIATAKTYIVPICREHAQVYEFYKRGVLRAGSIGYRTIEEAPLPPDPRQGRPRGKNLIRTELLETSPVFLPCHQDAVKRMYDEQWDGKSLCDSFRQLLEPVRPRKSPQSNGWRPNETVVEVRVKSMASATNAKGMKTAGEPYPAMSTTDDSAGGALVKPAGAKDVDPETEDAVIPDPVSHNVQRMTDVHYLCSAIRELIDADPHLLDHPELKKFLVEDIRPQIDKMVGDVSGKLAETHPDLEPLEGSKDMHADSAPGENETTEDEIAGDKKPTESGEKEPPKKDKPAAAEPDEPEHADDDEEEEDKPGKAWHAPTPKLKANAKSAKPATKGAPATGTKGLNMSQKACMKDLHEHLDECSKHPETPRIQKGAHAFWAGKVADMLDAGGKEQESESGMDAVEPGEDEPDQESKMLKLFKSFGDQSKKDKEDLRQLIRAELA